MQNYSIEIIHDKRKLCWSSVGGLLMGNWLMGSKRLNVQCVVASSSLLWLQQRTSLVSPVASRFANLKPLFRMPSWVHLPLSPESIMCTLFDQLGWRVNLSTSVQRHSLEMTTERSDAKVALEHGRDESHILPKRKVATYPPQLLRCSKKVRVMLFAKKIAMFRKTKKLCVLRCIPSCHQNCFRINDMFWRIPADRNVLLMVRGLFVLVIGDSSSIVHFCNDVPGSWHWLLWYAQIHRFWVRTGSGLQQTRAILQVFIWKSLKSEYQNPQSFSINRGVQ